MQIAKHIKEHSVLGLNRPIYNPAQLRIAVLGDSISDAYIYNETSGQEIFYATGYLNWARLFSNQALFFDSTLAHGNSGDTIAQCYARVSDVIASNPDICVVLAGTNDVSAATTAATMKSGLTSIYNALASAKIITVAMTITPRNDAGDTTAEHQKLMTVNEWIRQYCPRNGILVADPWRYLVNPAASDPDPHTAVVASDLIHPSATGGYWMGVALWEVLKSFVPTGELAHGIHPLDLYDATNFPTGNLLANGDLSGTGGTKNGTNPATGDVADSWIMTAVNASATGSMVGSIDTKDTGTGLTYNRQKFVYSNSATGATEEWWFNQTIDTHTGAAWDGTDKVQEGDQIYAEAEIEIESLNNVCGISIRVVENDGADNFLVDDMAVKQVTETIPAAYRGKLRTPVHTIRTYSGSGNVSLSIRIIFDVVGSTAASCTFYIGAPTVRKLQV